ncbi:hypothetical protein [Marinomonas sp. MED121]|uniref:hypothetical protein n=1 Tax=Marinomonas sp. MED121 TaxID=314277 RepID=UPI00030E1177|nr:hypothetical protein [Marinomonas sp. MED121]
MLNLTYKKMLFLMLLNSFLVKWAYALDSEASTEAQSSINESSHYQIKFGGWSKHYRTSGAANYDFNESHDGIGFAYSSYDKTGSSSHFFDGYNYEVWYMKDSFNKDNVQVSYGVFHRQNIEKFGIENIDYGLNLVAISRSYAEIDSETAQLANEKRIHAIFPFPSLSLYTSANVHFDFVFLPAISDVSDYHVFFFRAGIAL